MRRIARGIESLWTILAIIAFTKPQLRPRSCAVITLAMPRGIEPRSPERQSGIMTAILWHHLYKGDKNLILPLCLPSFATSGFHPRKSLSKKPVSPCSRSSDYASSKEFSFSLNLYVYIITQNFNIFKLFHFEIFWRHNCDSNADYLKGRAP